MEYDDQQAPSKLWLEIADEEKLYLAIPQGYQDHWNDVRGDCEHNGDEDDVGFINAMINEIQSRYSIERTDTFLSAYESVDFWVNFNNCDSIPESYVFPDGPYEDSSTVSREIYDNGVQNTEVILYRIDGGGHVEPSIEEQYTDWFLTVAGLGAQNHDIEMAREVWDFLKRHTLSGGTSVNNSSDDFSVKIFHLSQNYPNPFNQETAIEYQLTRAANMEISIFNLKGQKVTTLVKDYKTAGVHKTIWKGIDESGRQVVSGFYLYQLKNGNSVMVKKMLLLR